MSRLSSSTQNWLLCPLQNTNTKQTNEAVNTVMNGYDEWIRQRKPMYDLNAFSSLRNVHLPQHILSFIGLDEFVNKPVVENCKAMSSEEEPKVVRKNDDAPCIEEWVLDDEKEDYYEEIDGRYVAFGWNLKGGKITGKARTPQQNGVAERRNRTLIEAARTMLADFKLPTTFWAKAVNTACCVQNRVLVVKPHNKTPYELFHGRTPTLSFIRPFGCPVTILNNIDHLDKFDGKGDEGFFVGYSLNSKAFKVFNSITRIMEENLHIRFSESTPNAVGSGPDWLFDIDALTRTMNYEPVVAGTQSNDFTADLPFSQKSKSSHDDGSKPSSDDGKKVDKDLRKDSECNDQEKDDNVNSTNTVNAAGINKVNAVGGKTSIELPFDLNMPALEDYSIFDFSRDDEDDGAEADMNNLDTTIQVSPILTTRIHKDHPLDQVIGDLQSTTQTRKISKNLKEYEFVRKAKKSVKLMMEKLFRMELELMLFWSTVKAKTINGEEQLHALVDGKKIIITESSVRRDLQLADEEVYKSKDYGME
ncbi:putative ribonuclease H-like domain-containing protein [Tanacetum coccineum]